VARKKGSEKLKRGDRHSDIRFAGRSLYETPADLDDWRGLSRVAPVDKPSMVWRAATLGGDTTETSLLQHQARQKRI
jgi:hypothetical protein